MLSFDLLHPPDFESYYRQVFNGLSSVFYSSALVSEVLAFVLRDKPNLVVEREVSCYGVSKALKTFTQSNRLISVGEIGVQLWELPSFRELKYFEIAPMYLCAAIFSDEKTVVVGNDTLDFWDIETEKRVRQIDDCHHQTRMLALTEDEKILAGANFGKKINIWNVESGKLLKTLESADSYPTIQFSLDHTTLHVVTNGNIYEMNTTNGELNRIDFHFREVTAINELSGSLLLTVLHKVFSRSSDVEVWDFSKKELKWSSSHNAKVSGIFDIGTSVVSGGQRESLKLWDIETGRLLTEYAGGKDRSFARFDITPDRRRLIAATNAGLIIIFNLS